MVFFKPKKSNRKWHGRPQLYKGRFYQIKRALKLLFALLVVGGLVSSYYYLKTSDVLLVKNVEVLGEFSHLSQDQIISLSGLTPKDHLLSVDFNDVRQQIMVYPWVKDVRLNRKFPDTVQIYVMERSPMALVHLNDFYLIDQKGKIFTRAKPTDYNDLPVLTGFDEGEFKKYPELSKAQFHKTLSLLQKLEAENFYKDDPISEVHFDPVLGFTVFTKRFGYEVFYGQKKLKEKHEKLEKFYQSEYYRKVQALRLDLDGKNKIIARIKESDDTKK